MAEILNAHLVSEDVEMLRDDVVLDSGATHHVTNNKGKFIEGTYRKRNGWIAGLDANRAIAVKGSGSMKLRAQDGQYIMLTDVLYVPDAMYTLVSTGKLVKSGFAVSFTEDDIKVVDKRGQVVLRAVEKENVPVIVNGTSAGADVRSDVSKKSETIASPRSKRGPAIATPARASWSGVVGRTSHKVETIKSSTSQRGLQSKTSVNGKSGEHSELRAGRTSCGHGHRAYRPIRRGENWEQRGRRDELRERNVKQSGDKSARMRSVRAQ
jgi:hypothetical protein